MGKVRRKPDLRPLDHQRNRKSTRNATLMASWVENIYTAEQGLYSNDVKEMFSLEGQVRVCKTPLSSRSPEPSPGMWCLDFWDCHYMRKVVNKERGEQEKKTPDEYRVMLFYIVELDIVAWYRYRNETFRGVEQLSHVSVWRTIFKVEC